MAATSRPAGPDPEDEDDNIAKPGPRLPTGTGLPGERGTPELAPNSNGRSHPAGPARPDWQDPYATPLAGNGHSEERPGGRADLALGPWPAGNASAASINGGSRPGDVHARPDARPEVAPRPGIPGPPETSVPSDTTAQPEVAAGSSTIRPNDEIGRLTERVLTACRTAEGQSLFGGYGSSGLTPAIRRIAAQLPHGGLAPGSEANSLKSAERFAAKLARLVARNPGRPAEDLAWTIYDAIGTRSPSSHRITPTGPGWCTAFSRRKASNSKPDGTAGKVLNTGASGPGGEIRLTGSPSRSSSTRPRAGPWSSGRTEGYLRITDPAIPPGERARLRARQVAAAVEAKPPPRCMEIADFRSEAR